jgi:hypothetical protein
MLVACHDDAKPDPVATTTTPSASSPPAAPSAPPSAAATASTPSPLASAPTQTATTTPTSATTVAVTPSASAPPTGPAKPVFAHFAAPQYTVDASNPGTCKAGADCAVSLRFQTTGEFHVNDDYPYRFTANDAPGVQFLGSDGGGTFSKKTGDFQKANATSAVMNVRFRAAAAGTAAIAGTFKVAYCTDTACTPTTQSVALSVPIH